jgi:hypothetical protein
LFLIFFQFTFWKRERLVRHYALAHYSEKLRELFPNISETDPRCSLCPDLEFSDEHSMMFHYVGKHQALDGIIPSDDEMKIVPISKTPTRKMPTRKMPNRSNKQNAETSANETPIEG